jgi:hypothetical protein
MSQKHTDTKKLAKGIKYLAFTVPLLFLSPYILTLSFLNKENFSFYLFLIAGILIGSLAFFLFYKGIKTILDSIF